MGTILYSVWARNSDGTVQLSYLVYKEEVDVREGLQSSALLLLLLMSCQVFFQLHKQQMPVIVDLRRRLVHTNSIP